MLVLACYLPESLNFPKSELLKREAENGRSMGMTPLARGGRDGNGEGADGEKEGLLHEADV